MTIILIVSDSHDNLALVRKFVKEASKLSPDLIIHAGDYIAPFTLKEFAKLDAPLVGVFGNNDGEKILLKKVSEENGFKLYEQPYTFEWDGNRFILLHGVDGIETTKELINTLASCNEADIIVYGHTHQIDIRKVNRKLIINPGSLSGYLADKPSYVVLNLDTKEVKVKYL